MTASNGALATSVSPSPGFSHAIVQDVAGAWIIILADCYTPSMGNAARLSTGKTTWPDDFIILGNGQRELPRFGSGGHRQRQSWVTPQLWITSAWRHSGICHLIG
ncbi:hypothetical protein CHELA20_11507 [Hyphomicrobiales bacterium]|nr:hypothetical protein CHELA20_11507 [Hyphomicrobiales bacterium]CAH1695927.1 hypothetical protein CHELA41_51753 [Hyphomicrobiales bacterium]